MKVKKLVTVGILSLATILTGAGLAAAANSSTAGSSAAAHQAVHAKHSGKHGPWLKGNFIQTAAQALGMTAEDLAQELKSGKTLSDVATAKGKDSAKVAQDLQTAMANQIDEAVRAGKLSADQAAKLKSGLAQRVQSLMTKGWPSHRGQDQGHKRPGKSLGGKAMLRGLHEQLPTILGLDAASLKAEVSSGKSLAQIAQARGISKTDLLAKLQAIAAQNLDQAVKDGKLTPEEAANIKAKLPGRLGAMVDKVHPAKN